MLCVLLPCRHLVQLIQEELAERDSHAAFEGLILPLLQDEVRAASMDL